MPASRRGRGSAEQAEQTKLAILTAALSLFAERGFDAVGLRDIAEAAGITHGLIRHHFGTKDRIWDAVLDHADDNWTARMAPAVARAAHQDDPSEALRELAGALTRTASAYPEITRLLIGESIRGGPRLHRIVERLGPARAALDAVCTRLRAQGLLPALDSAGFFLVVLLATTGPFALSALAEHVGAPPPDDPEQHADRVLRTLLDQQTNH